MIRIAVFNGEATAYLAVFPIEDPETMRRRVRERGVPSSDTILRQHPVALPLAVGMRIYTWDVAPPAAAPEAITNQRLRYIGSGATVPNTTHQ